MVQKFICGERLGLNQLTVSAFDKINFLKIGIGTNFYISIGTTADAIEIQHAPFFSKAFRANQSTNGDKFANPPFVKIIQIGNAKSGNFWIYQIVQQILNEANIERKSYIQNQPIYEVAKTWKLSFSDQASVDNLMITPSQYYYRISSILQMPIENLDDYISQTTHVWLQSPPCKLTTTALSKFDKIIYIVRDPRDIAISNSKYAFTPYRSSLFPPHTPHSDLYLDQKLNHEIHLWVTHVGGYLKLRSQIPFYVLFYENLIHSFEEELNRLLAYLNIQLDESAKQRIQQEVSLESMKAANPQHVRQGKIYQWQHLLTPQQKKRVIRIAKPMLSLLHYPLELSDAATVPLPLLPKSISSQQLSVAMTCADRKFNFSRIRSKVFSYFHADSGRF